MANVVVIGLGYIGLPTAAMLALHGSDVHGVDISPQTLEALHNGNIPIRKKDLTAIVRDAIRTNRLRISEKPKKAEYFVLCVPTPKKDRQADLSAVKSAAKTIAGYVGRGSTVIVESTVPPGTCSDTVRPILEKGGLQAGPDFHLAYCPERVMPGNIIREIQENDRIVGGLSPMCAERARELYATFVRGKIHLTDLATAEFVKLAENAFRDVNIAFANELADLAEAHGVDIWEVIDLANRHPRVNILRPGPGVGGHCIPVDPLFLLSSKVRARMIPAARDTNDCRPPQVVRIARSLLRGVRNPKVAAMGVAFKGNADDIRESPAIAVIDQLQEEGVRIAAYDPMVAHDLFSTVHLEEAIEGAVLLIDLAERREFAYIDPEMIARKVRRRFLFDTRNAVDHIKWAEASFEVHVLGNANVFLSRKRAVEAVVVSSSS